MLKHFFSLFSVIPYLKNSNIATVHPTPAELQDIVIKINELFKQIVSIIVNKSSKKALILQ